MIVKIGMHNVLIIWKISTEKNFGKSKKKFLKKFSRIFFCFFFSIFFLAADFFLPIFFRTVGSSVASGGGGVYASEASRPPEASHSELGIN